MDSGQGVLVAKAQKQKRTGITGKKTTKISSTEDFHWEVQRALKRCQEFGFVDVDIKLL